MRADLDNIVYIIITILVLVFSALKKKKVPQGTTVESEEGTLSDTIFPELKEIERMLQRQEAESHEYEEEVEAYSYEAESLETIPESLETVTELKYTSLEDYVPLVSNAFSTMQDGNLEKMTSSLEEKEEQVPENLPLGFIPENFDLRQAVIQTEILNRKYF